MQKKIERGKNDLTAEQLKKQKELFRESLKYIEVGENPPHLISIIGPNRSGTTAFAEIFARLNIPNYLQPIKSIRRAIEESDDVPSFELAQGIPLAVHKETLGSKTESEFFDPIETLLAAGYPPERIHLVVMLRDPRMALTSWNKIYQEGVNTEGLVRAVNQTEEIANNAKKRGIKVTHYVHEAIRDNDVEVVAAKVFKALGIKLSRKNLAQTVNWQDGARFGSEKSTGIFYDKPPEIFVEGVKTRPGYQYKKDQKENITPKQRRLLKRSGILNIYNKFKKAIRKDIGLRVK